MLQTLATLFLFAALLSMGVAIYKGSPHARERLSDHAARQGRASRRAPVVSAPSFDRA